MDTHAMERVNGLLGEFGMARNIAGARLDPSGICAFDYRDQFQVVLELSEDGQTLHWHGTLGSVPLEEREDFYAGLLEQNLLCLETNGATLAVNRDDNAVVLCFNHPVETLNFPAFSNIMENFLNTAAALQADLNPGLEGDARGGHNTGDPLLDMTYRV